MKCWYSNSKFKISTSRWYDKFEWPGGSYSVSIIQYFFRYILKKHEENIDNPSMKIYVHQIENRITFKIKMDTFLNF